ncbi:hypothetical protein VNO80_19228 [Phaseolus coccineus]|uniref:Uncharacterized protein n=1 Tax=Phaseolus coccineus TaxID=3886 RepID=A0AAN9MFR0_PHACN
MEADQGEKAMEAMHIYSDFFSISIKHFEGDKHVVGLLIDLDLVSLDGRDIEDEVHAMLVFLLLQLKGDFAHGTLLVALREVIGEANNFVAESL